MTALSGPVGFEEPVLTYVREQLGRSCERVDVDVRGNVYGHQPGTSADGPRIMVTAHADEIGFMVTSILPGGYLRFAKLGQPTDQVLPGQRIRVLSKSGPLEGVIGVKPGHVLTPSEARQTPAIEEMYFDVGASSATEASDWGIESGTPAVFVGELMPTRNPHRCFGKSVDNRAGVAAVLAISRQLADSTMPASRVYTNVVDEEVGLRAAAMVAAAAGATRRRVGDRYSSRQGARRNCVRTALPWEIGEGPLIKVRETRGLSTHPVLRDLIRRVAFVHEIPYQLIVDTAGITDATAAQQAGSQVAAAVIGLARRYAHSAVEMFDITDVQALIELVSLTIAELKTKSQLLRI